MKKQLVTSLLSLLFTASLACAQTETKTTSTTTDSKTTCPASATLCATTAMECANGKLNKEESMRFCDAKAAAVAVNPSLAKPENKCALCRAIIKADPSMKPIIMKMKKNCPKSKHCEMTSPTLNKVQKNVNATQNSATTALDNANAAVQNSLNTAKEVTSTETTTTETSTSN